MAEFINPEEDLLQGGHHPDTSNTLLELHRLLALFLASKRFADLRTHWPGEGFDPIYKIQEVEEYEITRLLLTLSITARVMDDREKRVFQTIANCGQLETDRGTEILDLREACNKIIHAKRVRLDIEQNGEQPYLNPLIYLYGEHKGKCWRATVDVIAFAKYYVSRVIGFY